MPYYGESPLERIVDVHWKKKEPDPEPDSGVPCGSYTYRVDIYGPSGDGAPPVDNIIYTEHNNWWMGNTHSFNGVQWTGVTPFGNTPWFNTDQTISHASYGYMLNNMLYFPHPEEPDEDNELYHYVPMGAILRFQIDFSWFVADVRDGVNPIPPTEQWGIGFSRLWSNPYYVGGGSGVPDGHPEAADSIHFGQPFMVVGAGPSGSGSYVYDFKADDWMRWQNTPIDPGNVNDPNFGGPGVITWHFNNSGTWAHDRFGFGAETLLHGGGVGSFFEWTITGICRTPPPPPPNPPSTRQRIITRW